jgi:glyoxylase-like metal-dependent hydrolase (beta-lactamase superfamily II)
MVMTLTTLAPGIQFGDLAFQGRPRIIATAFMFGADGVTVVDPGPSSSLPTLKAHLASAGAGLADVTRVLLTHIHLDHAGACGSLLRENPRIVVCVHQAGAPHLVDPTKLVASAGRLYGDAMDRLWGEVAPVPASALHIVNGGERVSAGGRVWDVAFTPGHASHHVCYFSPDTGLAFVGDTAGVQVVPGGFVLPPTPPPDIDIARWMTSLAAIEAWHPQTLFLTHFGPSNQVTAHLAELRDHLHVMERLADSALARPDDDAGREAWFIGEVRRLVGRRMPEEEVRAYEVAGRFDLNWRGLVRHAKTRGH